VLDAEDGGERLRHPQGLSPQRSEHGIGLAHPGERHEVRRLHLPHEEGGGRRTENGFRKPDRALVADIGVLLGRRDVGDRVRP